MSLHCPGKASGPPSELADVAKEREVWGPLLKLLPLRHDYWEAIDNGWMDDYCAFSSIVTIVRCIPCVFWKNFVTWPLCWKQTSQNQALNNRKHQMHLSQVPCHERTMFPETLVINQPEIFKVKGTETGFWKLKVTCPSPVENRLLNMYVYVFSYQTF